MAENPKTNLYIKMQIVTPVACGMLKGRKTEEIILDGFANKLEALKALEIEITKLIAKEHGVLK